MRQDLIRKAQNVLLERKLKAENEYNSKMQSLFESEEYQKLNRKLTKLLISNARAESLGEKPNKTLEKELLSQIESMKKNAGLADVKLSYNCPDCKDEGFVDGKMCKCLKTEISKILLQESGFEKLESFATSAKTSGDLSKHYALMQEWCNKDSNKTLIYLAGPTGVGKTHLVRCMANELIGQGKIVKLVTAFNMNQDFKEFAKTSNEELLNKYTSPEILVIDDLGTEPKYKDVTIELLYLVINERKVKKLPTIITSNLDLADIRDTYDERIYSRIVDRQTSINLLLNGEDRRIKK